MSKRLRFPYRYELKIGEEHKGKMDAELIRWVTEQRDVIGPLKDEIDGKEEVGVMFIYGENKLNLEITWK